MKQLRTFWYGEIELTDPDPSMSTMQVKEFYQITYPEMVNSKIEQVSENEYKFEVVVKRKG